MNKKIVLSGMQPTGSLHLGNYLGGLKGMLVLQDDPDYETYYFVVDAHVITVPYDVAALKENTRGAVLDYLATGLDPEKSVIFVQSMVPEHFELAHYLSSEISVARMQHLPTYKGKVKQHAERSSMALLNYPILMAADILAYKASAVPVGIDQEPHLEVTRQIARKMNSKYGMDFPEPQAFRTEGAYVPSLLGEGKMSKSVGGSYISLGDSLDEIKSKLAKAPTDAGKGEKVPTEGSVANLLTFVELFQGGDKRKEYEEMYVGSGIKYQELKDSLAKVIYAEIKPIQEARKEKEAIVDEVIVEGAKRAREVATKTLSEVKEKMGFM